MFSMMISYLTTLTMYYVIVKLNDKTDFIDRQAFENFSENISEIAYKFSLFYWLLTTDNSFTETWPLDCVSWLGLMLIIGPMSILLSL